MRAVLRGFWSWKIGPWVAFALPLTPWPILIWIQSQGTYMWSARHSAEALHAVGRQALVTCLITTLLGLVALLSCRQRAELLFYWLVVAGLNAIALWSYIEANAVAYANGAERGGPSMCYAGLPRRESAGADARVAPSRRRPFVAERVLSETTQRESAAHAPDGLRSFPAGTVFGPICPSQMTQFWVADPGPALPLGRTLKQMDTWERCSLPDEISYDQWVRYVFEHPVLDPQWWWQDPESGFWQGWNESAEPDRTLSYLTQLFELPEGLMGRFSRAQIDQGLNFLVSNSCSNHMYVLSDENLPWANRRKCFDAMVPLYEKLMAPIYGDDLGHAQRGASDPERPTFACYMWWDIIPLYGGMDHSDRDRINEAVLHVFAQVLSLKAESCLESVLHGLGHWHLYVPDRTEAIARRFLGRTDVSPELRSYAECAAVGGVQ